MRCSRWYCNPESGAAIVVEAGRKLEGHNLFTTPLEPYTRCTSSDTAICVQQGRYKIETTWHDFIGQSGPGHPVRVTDETAYFWFFDPGNVELMVKALNACRTDLGTHFWIFAAGLTNVQVEMKVTDTLTGQVKTYGNPLGQVIPPLLDVAAFDTCSALEPGGAFFGEMPEDAGFAAEAAARRAPAPEPISGGACVPGLYTACLTGGRFEVAATYQVASPGRGPPRRGPAAHRRQHGLLFLLPGQHRAAGQGARRLQPAGARPLGLRRRPDRPQGRDHHQGHRDWRKPRPTPAATGLSSRSSTSPPSPGSCD